ncbi:MAG: 50S ribosomal protein L18e [Thermoplasmatales archaeon]
MGVNEKDEREKLALDMKKTALESDSRFWGDIAKRIRKSKDNLVEVNVGKISRFAATDETVVVPGVVLGSGRIEEPIRVAALYFSKSARLKIEEAGGKAMTLKELMVENTKGTNVKIIG